MPSISIEFEQATITTRRREAANTIAHFFRQKKALDPIYLCIREKIEIYRQRRSTISTEQKQKILEEIQQLDRAYLRTSRRFESKAQMIRQRKFEVLHSDEFNLMVHTHATSGQYQLIDYHHPDFMKHLFGAFELSLINMNDMISIKLIYDALLCFHHGQLPPNPAASLTRYQLSDGPLQTSSIEYWSHRHTEKLQIALDTTENPEKYHYYTIGLDDVYTDYLIFEMLWKNFNPSYFSKLLLTYIQRKGPEFEGSLITARNYLRNQAPGFKIELIRQLFANQKPLLDQKEKDTVLFLIAVERLVTHMPSIIINASGSHLIEFIIPSMDCFNLIQDILHGREAVYPCGVVGKQSPRLIRAFDEIPSLAPGQSLTDAQKTLVGLYPISQTLGRPRRPVEITYPNIPYEDNPHDFKPYDFMLLWHDLFHAWRSGSNFKKIIRELRLLHDEKFGYSTHRHRGMSPAIWNLTDMDTSAGLLYRSGSTIPSFFASFKLFIEQMVFKISDINHPENYLFLFDLVKNPSRWEPLPFIHYMESVGEHLKNYPDAQFKKFYTMYLDIKKHLESRPEASFFEVYLTCVLKPTHPLEIKVFQALSDEICQQIFEWGPYEVTFKEAFYQNVLEGMGFPKTLKKCLHYQKSFLMYIAMYLQLNYDVHIPQEDLLSYFKTLGESGFYLLSRLNVEDLSLFITMLFSKDEMIPEMFFQIVVEQNLLSILWNKLTSAPENLLLWQIECIQDSHYIFKDEHIDYIFETYQKATKRAIPALKIEFILLQTPEGFAKLIQHEKPKFLESFIHLTKHLSIDIKRHIFYNRFNEVYYILKHSIRLPETERLKLCIKYPESIPQILATLPNQEAFVEHCILQYFPEIHKDFIDEALQEISLDILLKTAIQLMDNEEQFIIASGQLLPSSPELNQLFFDMQKTHPDRQYYKISTLSFMTRNQMYRIYKAQAAESISRSSSPSFFGFFSIQSTQSNAEVYDPDAENAVQNLRSSPFCVPWLGFR